LGLLRSTFSKTSTAAVPALFSRVLGANNLIMRTLLGIDPNLLAEPGRAGLLFGKYQLY
jgi:hypothetical protein